MTCNERERVNLQGFISYIKIVIELIVNRLLNRIEENLCMLPSARMLRSERYIIEVTKYDAPDRFLLHRPLYYYSKLPAKPSASLTSAYNDNGNIDAWIQNHDKSQFISQFKHVWNVTNLHNAGQSKTTKTKTDNVQSLSL